MPNTVPSASPWPHRVRRAAASVVVIGVFVLSLFIANSPTQAAKPVRPTPTPATCDLIPQLRDVTINQGVGGYTPLVRGKETLVRAYLSKPSCASSTAIIELVGGSLAVAAGTTTTTISAPTPVPTTPYPQMAESSAAALADSTADPVFVVPGSALAPTSTTARFNATFSVTVRYQSRTSSSATPVSGQITFTTRPGSSTPITTTVEKRTNALRVLVVPMGDATRPFAETYTAAGDAALQAAMLTVSRIFPLPDGVGSLTGTTGGLRYSVSPGMLDLSGLVGADGRFCGTGGTSGNFNSIKASLGQFLQSWNAANGADHQADRVLGVVDGSFSNGSAEGCAEGMAAIDSTEAWIRAIPATQAAPSQSGLVAALELGHTFGLVPDARDSLFSRYHSPNPYADPLRQNRSYNTRLRTLLYEDRTAMTYISSANNNNTLLEQVDWAYLICKFGGATTSDCPTQPVPVGSGAGLAAGPRFVISGVTDGTAAGTEVLESFFSADMLPTSSDPAARFRLVYRSGGGVIGELGLPTTDEDSAHDHGDHGDPHHEPGIHLFSGAFEFDTSADRIELWDGSPGTGELLYARDRSGVPLLDQLTVVGGGDGAQNYTDDTVLQDVDPAISADGQWVAWSAFEDTEGGFRPSIRVAPIDEADAATVLDDGEVEIVSFQPAWCSDGAQLAYADDDGDLWIVSVDTSEVPVTFGSPELLYNGDPIEGLPPASHPTWSPDCSQLAFEASDDIWRIDADGANLVALTEDGLSHDPSWSPDPEDNRIAFARDIESVAVAGATFASFVEPESDPITTLEHAGAHFVVNTIDDEDDGACNSEHCSLREAIIAANGTANVDGPDVIEFTIGGTAPHTISPASALPAITDYVLIDGTSEPDYTGTPVVQIDGTDAGAEVDGIIVGFTTAGVTLRALSITNFTANAVAIFGTGAAVEGSYLGLDPDGVAAGNGDRGIYAVGASGLRVGVGADIGSGNVISGNGWHGISVEGGSVETPVTGVTIAGNLIGTNSAGDAAIGNSEYGINLSGFTRGAQIGGTTAARRNVISGNSFGVVITGSDARSNVLEGNFIGTDVSGTADLGNIGDGVVISGSGHNRIGQAFGAGATNVISGNGDDNAADGIDISGDGAFNNLIYRNFIGTDATGTNPLGNTSDGIEIRSGDQTVIGGAPAQNTIASNGEAGIRILGGIGHAIRANILRDNGGLGIDLGDEGVTANDAGDADVGPNNLQNYPVITSAIHDGTSLTVEGTISTFPGASMNVDIYRNDGCDASNHGEGLTWLAETFVVTDGSGEATFSRTGLSASIGDVITVVGGEGVSNSSSEFSPCATVTGPATPTFTVNTADDHDDGACTTDDCSLREAINRANTEAGTDTITFDIGGGGAHTIFVTEADLPSITETVIIDGETQGGFEDEPLIRIEGGDELGTGIVVAPTAVGSTLRGLLVTGFPSIGVELAADGSLLERSWIGLDHAGAAAGNGGAGVRVIGDDVRIVDSVISANGGHGVLVFGRDILITGSRVGTDPTGSADRGNGADGVHVEITDNAVLGGSGALGNVISGNADDGVEITNGGEGDSGNHRIYGNTIGLNAAGDAALANDGHGINLRGVGETYVGVYGFGDDDPARNVISGNRGSGIYLGSIRFDLQFHGNYIGTDATGTTAIGNAESGIFIDRSQDASIGEGDAETRNVISGNAVGITLHETDWATTVLGNYIGTNAAGDAAVPNGIGVVLDAAIDEQIGGRFEGDGNVISGNTGDGIYVSGDSELESFAIDNAIQGNFIGTDATGLLPLGNGGNGITIDDTTDSNLVGGDTDVFPFAANVIGGNAGHGVSIVNSDQNVIQGNVIGTDLGRTEDLGNGGAGVRITGPSQHNQVGAEIVEGVEGPGNAIANNGGNGVEVLQTGSEPAFDADFTSILSNDIWDNGGLGIDLEADGVTPNDPGDGDDASNDLKNFPDDIGAVSDGETTFGTVSTFSSAPAEIINFQLFVSTECDPSGNGEGQRFLQTEYAAADETGFASSEFFVNEDLAGQFLTATITDNQGQTSEFSECFEVNLDPGDPEREIRVLDANEGGRSSFVTDGDEPFWGADGILYRLGGIRQVQPDGSGDEEITDGFDHTSPASGGGIIGFSAVGDSSDADIYLISGVNTVIVSATDDVPEDLRLDLYYACGGQIMPIAVGLRPDQSDDESASFQYNFDASLSCSGGEILAALSDGFSRSTTPEGQGEQIETDPKPPIAATYGPPLGSTYVTSDVIAFHGSGEDPDDGPLTGAALEWYINAVGDPCCGTPVGSGEQVDYDASQLTPGDYIVTLVVTDSDGETDSAESLIHVLEDSDNDGFSDSQESTTCLGADAATDGSTPSADADSDGIPNGSDPDPCVRAPAEADATADFDPDAFSLSSNGTWVTIYIETPGRDVRQVAPASVRIVEIAGETVNIANEGISYKGSRLVAKFRRASLTDYFTSNGLTSGNIPITVRGSSTTLPSWSFEASDMTLVHP